MNIDSQIECVKREIQRRKRFYPSLIAQMRMTQEAADFEIMSMQQVYQTLTQLRGLVKHGS